MQEEKYADLIWDHDEDAHKKFIENLAPIVLFTYNRLEHTQKTIAALQENLYAAESELYIYSDGPKNDAAKESVEAVRLFLHQVDGFKQVHIIERDKNWGLAENIIDGVTSIVNEYGKIIVLEDDIVTGKYFLKYMNDALEVYKNESRVMEINGYAPDNIGKNLPQAFFIEGADCWGWATWARAWKFFRREPERVRDSFTQEDIFHFNMEGAYTGYWEQVIANCNGSLYTWAIFWHAAIFTANGLSLMPRDSFVNNEGLDGTGEHCGESRLLAATVNDKPVDKFPMVLAENKTARENLRQFLFRHSNCSKKNILYRGLRYIMSKIWDMKRGES